MENLSTDDWDAMITEFNQNRLPESVLKLFNFVGRICSFGYSERLLSSVKAHETIVDSKELLDIIFSRPSVFVKSAIKFLKAITTPHVYQEKDKFKLPLYQKALNQVDEISQEVDHKDLKSEKQMLLSEEYQELIIEGSKYVNQKLGNFVNKLAGKAAKGKSYQVQCIVFAFCKWTIAMAESSEVTFFNQKQHYVSSVGVLQKHLISLRNKIFTRLNDMMSTPRSLCAFHFMRDSTTSSRVKRNEFSDIFKILLGATDSLFETKAGAHRCLDLKAGLVDIRTKPHLIFLQHSRDSISKSLLWDTVTETDERLAMLTLNYSEKQVSREINISNNIHYLAEDACGWEHLIKSRMRCEFSSMEGKQNFISCLLRYIVYYSCLSAVFFCYNALYFDQKAYCSWSRQLLLHHSSCY